DRRPRAHGEEPDALRAGSAADPADVGGQRRARRRAGGMRPPVPTHPEDDRLLELAYGEVPASEARALRQHVDGCARCRKVLDGIAEVRTAFRSIPEEPAREKGLESLLPYGEQAAARPRSRRGGLRILALLSAATAFAVVWLGVSRTAPPPDSPPPAPRAQTP